jgi:putative Mg2+ transporter-C (MgtC) family protein
MLSAVHQVQWLSDTPEQIIRIDPVRMAHGILTGIGFLCGGVIFREGISVRGLTTAASLWTTSALGVLFGVGFFPLAAGATLATLIVLAAADLTEWLLPQKRMAELTVRYERSAEDSYSYLLGVITAHAITHSTVSERVTGDAHELSTTISWKEAKRERALAATLRSDPKVLSFNLAPK